MKALLVIAPISIAALLAACAPRPEKVGDGLFNDYCTSCHGTSGQGDGPAAKDLDRTVPDLTLISERNAGSFPTSRVMTVIDGYTRAREGKVTMPEFGIELQAGPLVLYDSGDGLPTPTPSKLVALAEYLKTIQR